MSVRLNGSTSGYTELDAPAVAGNNTIKLPASNGAANQLIKNSGTAGQLTYSQATEDSAGNFAFNSGYGSVAPVYGCRAWVNFDGTGAIGTNQTIRASGNVASVYKNGTGDYTITFVTPMPDANYVVNFAESYTSAGGVAFTVLNTLAGSFVRINSLGNYPSGYASLSDSSLICVAIFR